MSTTVELNRALGDAVKWQERAEALEAKVLLLKSRIRYLEGLLCETCEGEGLLPLQSGGDFIECRKCEGTGRPV